mmetsp:Transcript_42915/g.68911  ORF Transcript_42915/g.68911 Transcript_42915/m.68911 type:complete len:216 (+) Transcript_42915:222-869(+)
MVAPSSLLCLLPPMHPRWRCSQLQILDLRSHSLHFSLYLAHGHLAVELSLRCVHLGATNCAKAIGVVGIVHQDASRSATQASSHVLRFQAVRPHLVLLLLVVRVLGAQLIVALPALLSALLCLLCAASGVGLLSTASGLGSLHIARWEVVFGVEVLRRHDTAHVYHHLEGVVPTSRVLLNIVVPEEANVSAATRAPCLCVGRTIPRQHLDWRICD